MNNQHQQLSDPLVAPQNSGITSNHGSGEQFHIGIPCNDSAAHASSTYTNTTISGSNGKLELSIGVNSICVSYRGTNANLVVDSLRPFLRDKQLEEDTASISQLSSISQESYSLEPNDSISVIGELRAASRNTRSIYSATDSTVAPGRVAGSLTTASFTDAGDLRLFTAGELSVRVVHPEDRSSHPTVAMLDSGATGPSPNLVTKSFLEDDLRCPYTEESSVVDLPGGHTLPTCGTVRLKFYPQFQNQHTGQREDTKPYKLIFHVVNDHEHDPYFGDMCLGLNVMREMRVLFNATSFVAHMPNAEQQRAREPERQRRNELRRTALQKSSTSRDESPASPNTPATLSSSQEEQTTPQERTSANTAVRPAGKIEEEPAKLGSKSPAGSRWSKQVERLSERFRPSRSAKKSGRRSK